jgi:hypothetical protein
VEEPEMAVATIKPLMKSIGIRAEARDRIAEFIARQLRDSGWQGNFVVLPSTLKVPYNQPEDQVSKLSEFTVLGSIIYCGTSYKFNCKMSRTGEISDFNYEKE